MSDTPAPSRRALLQAMAAAGACVLVPGAARAMGPSSQVDVAEIELASGTVSRPEAWQRLLYELVQTTSIESSSRVAAVAPDDLALFEHPFAVLPGDGAFAPLSEAAVEQLHRYLSYGGFLVIDDVTGAQQSAFDRSVRRLCGRLFPTRPLSPLPADHSLYRAFFLLGRPLGRVDTHDWLEGVNLGEITPLIYCRNDLSGALARGPDGRHLYAVTPGGEYQRGEAIKLGINLIMYALTSNYKKDQAHVRQLMLEGRLE